MEAPEKVFSLKELRSKLPEDAFTEFLGICNECGGELSHADGCFACRTCGREFNDGGEVEGGIPISGESVSDGHAESHWSPQSLLAFGKAHGTNDLINNAAMCRIVAGVRVDGEPALCPSCHNPLPSELGLRARQIRILTSKGVDHPALRAMLGFASQLCNCYGLHNRGRSCIVFAEDLGRWVRAVGAVSILRNDKSESWRGLVRASFLLLVETYFPDLSPKVRGELKVSIDDLSKVRFMVGQYRMRNGGKADGAWKAIVDLYELGFRFLRDNGLTGDDGFCSEFSSALWRCGVNITVCGVDDREFAAKAVLALVAEKRFGKGKTDELMQSLGLSDRMLGKAESILP